MQYPVALGYVEPADNTFITIFINQYDISILINFSNQLASGNGCKSRLAIVCIDFAGDVPRSEPARYGMVSKQVTQI